MLTENKIWISIWVVWLAARNVEKLCGKNVLAADFSGSKTLIAIITIREVTGLGNQGTTNTHKIDILKS